MILGLFGGGLAGDGAADGVGGAGAGENQRNFGSGPGSRDQDVKSLSSRLTCTVHCTLYMYMYYVVHVGPTGTVDLFEASSLTPL